MFLSMIVARGRNGVIGADGALPWHIPADLKFFKATTLGKPVIMGRKTYESIGRPLPGRQNVVITRNRDWQAAGVLVVHDADGALASVGDSSEAIIIGGEQIYRLFMARADRLYVTEVAASPEGDAKFPEIDPAQWRETSRDDHPADGDRPAFAFVVYDRRVTR